MRKDRRIMPLLERFMKKVRVTSGCWLWLASKCGKGYGSMRVNKVQHTAHRVSYRLAYGEIPPGMYVCHKCDNPGCVRPSHLFLGTSRDNSHDMLAKGRHKHNSRHKYSLVLRVRRLNKRGASPYKIAKALGLPFQTVYSWTSSAARANG